jgi:hypothetical protein
MFRLRLMIALCILGAVYPKVASADCKLRIWNNDARPVVLWAVINPIDNKDALATYDCCQTIGVGKSQDVDILGYNSCLRNWAIEYKTEELANAIPCYRQIFGTGFASPGVAMLTFMAGFNAFYFHPTCD